VCGWGWKRVLAKKYTYVYRLRKEGGTFSRWSEPWNIPNVAAADAPICALRSIWRNECFFFSYVNMLLSYKYKACHILFILCKFKFNFYILVESVKKNSALSNQLNKMYISMQTVIPIPSSMQCPCVRMTFGSSCLLFTTHSVRNNCILCFAQKLFTVHVYFFCNGYLTRTFMMTCKCKWFAWAVNWCHILQRREE